MQHRRFSADRLVSGLSFVKRSQIADLAENICHSGPVLSADRSVSGLSFVRKSQIADLAENGTGSAVAISIIFLKTVANSIVKNVLGTGSLESKAIWFPKSIFDSTWYEKQGKTTSMETENDVFQ